MARNTYKQDEQLEEPFNIRHLLRASVYIKKYLKYMLTAPTPLKFVDGVLCTEDGVPFFDNI